LTAGCAFGSIVGVWLFDGGEVIGLDVDVFAAGFRDPTPAPQAAVAKTATASPAMIRYRFVNAFSVPGLARRL
jgi:hypothetical protein